MIRLAGLLLLAALPAAAQESGWRYSPYDGEGDRAAMGCAYGSSPASHTCVVVRCDDDFSVGLYIETSRIGGDAGRWEIDVDRELETQVSAVAVAGSPYGARVEGDTAPILAAIRNGASLYIEPLDGAAVTRNGIGLSGSLRAITQALYFCAPRVDPKARTDETDPPQ